MSEDSGTPIIGATFAAGTGVLDEHGRRGHPGTIEHNERLARRLYQIGDRAWCLVGNGLSNQSFVLGPEGLIVIDTGESVEEMREALHEVRQVCDAPIVACIYTHFHYVAGTAALLEDTGGREIPIYGHAGIAGNLERTASEVAPRGGRGMVYQFGISLPKDTADGLINVGLGRFFRNPEHAPFTPGHLPATETFSEPVEHSIAGLQTCLYPAPSDANDSVTIWFPALGLAVNNLVWPALFNVFAIRGEEYRDPRIVLDGLDQLAGLDAEHMVGAHGPPLSGRDDIRECINLYRDAIQYLWDQSVRGINRGLSADELVTFVQLPDVYNTHFTTTQLYGVVEHHVRQIYAGLFGWFDENEANLVPLPPPERIARLIEGFGGVEAVRSQADTAIAKEDYRWAIELSSWLVRSERTPNEPVDGGAPEDRGRLAAALRGVGHNTTSANLRNWCLTRALELEGTLDLRRFRTHRLRAAEVSSNPSRAVATLRVLFDPERAGELEDSICFDFGDTQTTLSVRHGIAAPRAGSGAELTVRIAPDHFGQWLAGKASYQALLDSGIISLLGDRARIERILGCFDVDLLGRSSP
jgi:alkyl sulfatase BDS1-like metallo-beta-lactamase superfamily hydrolase